MHESPPPPHPTLMLLAIQKIRNQPPICSYYGGVTPFNIVHVYVKNIAIRNGDLGPNPLVEGLVTTRGAKFNTDL